MKCAFMAAQCVTKEWQAVSENWVKESRWMMNKECYQLEENGVLVIWEIQFMLKNGKIFIPF